MQHINTVTVAACVLALTVVGGCSSLPGGDKSSGAAASAGYPPEIEQRLQERGLRVGQPVGQIILQRISGWNRIDNRHITLTAGVSDKYLVTLIRHCRGLDDAESIRFSTVGGDITPQDQVLAGNPDAPDLCQIRDIRRLERVKARKDGESHERETAPDAVSDA